MQKQKFLTKKNDQHRITFLSVGNARPSMNLLEVKSSFKNLSSININPEFEAENTFERSELKDKIICLGEYSDNEECFYLTFIKPLNPGQQYQVKSTEKYCLIF